MNPWMNATQFLAKASQIAGPFGFTYTVETDAATHFGVLRNLGLLFTGFAEDLVVTVSIAAADRQRLQNVPLLGKYQIVDHTVALVNSTSEQRVIPSQVLIDSLHGISYVRLIPRSTVLVYSCDRARPLQKSLQVLRACTQDFERLKADPLLELLPGDQIRFTGEHDFFRLLYVVSK